MRHRARPPRQRRAPPPAPVLAGRVPSPPRLVPAQARRCRRLAAAPPPRCRRSSSSTPGPRLGGGRRPDHGDKRRRAARWTRQYSGTAALQPGGLHRRGARLGRRPGHAAAHHRRRRHLDGGAEPALSSPERALPGHQLRALRVADLGYAIARRHGRAGTGSRPPGRRRPAAAHHRRRPDLAAGSRRPGQPAGRLLQQSASTATSARPGRIWHTTDGGHDLDAGVHRAARGTGQASGGRSATRRNSQCAGQDAAWVLFLGQGTAMLHAPYLAYATRDGRSWHGVSRRRCSSPRSARRCTCRRARHRARPVQRDQPRRRRVRRLHPAGQRLGRGAARAGDQRRRDAQRRAGNIAAINEPLAATFLTPDQGWVVGENLKTEHVRDRGHDRRGPHLDDPVHDQLEARAQHPGPGARRLGGGDHGAVLVTPRRARRRPRPRQAGLPALPALPLAGVLARGPGRRPRARCRSTGRRSAPRPGRSR